LYFQDGAIKGNEINLHELCIRHFNSKMVRLKVANVPLLNKLNTSFQFQDGAIKGFRYRTNSSNIEHISIPVWCD